MTNATAKTSEQLNAEFNQIVSNLNARDFFAVHKVQAALAADSPLCDWYLSCSMREDFSLDASEITVCVRTPGMDPKYAGVCIVKVEFKKDSIKIRPVSHSTSKEWVGVARNALIEASREWRARVA